MKKLFALMAAAGVMVLASTTTQAISEAEIRSDIAAFQGFFLKRFPSLTLEDFVDGVNALPQYAHRRANWELLMEFPPYEPEMEKAEQEWSKAFANGKTFADCTLAPANTYPVYDAGSDDLHTLVGDLNACLAANGEKPIKNVKHGKMARLVAHYRAQFNGERMAVDFSAAGAQAWYEKGRQFYWAKRGQLNFSCANCHIQNAGNSIRGDVLSPGLGHTVGFPVYRTKWAVAGKPWGTVHRRYGGCNKQVRASPFKAQGTEYKALEYYEAIMNTGVPLKVPSQRQ
jgi:sulfur-oxidizing protein SoxA